MIKLWFSLFVLVIAGWSPVTAAQDVWAYATIARDSPSTIRFTPPVDLTYPKPGQPIPMLGPNEDAASRGIRLTPQQAARRLAEPKVVILLLPVRQAENIRTMPTSSEPLSISPTGASTTPYR